MDFALRGKGTSDPYVTVTTSQSVLAAGEREVFRTLEQPATLDPVFDAVTRFSVSSSEEILTFSVFDKDAISGDDPMGDAKIWLRDIAWLAASESKEVSKDFKLRLQPSKKCPKTQGFLKVQVRFGENPPWGKVVTLAD